MQRAAWPAAARREVPLELEPVVEQQLAVEPQEAYQRLAIGVPQAAGPP